MANATSTQLQELYVAYFGRAADPNGLDYWTEKGITTSQFAADMYVQAEFKDVYGSLSTEAQVNQIYKNLFDREADVTGLNYWTLEVNLGNLKIAEIATHLIWAAQNNDGSADDKTALTNRANAAVAYTAKVKESTAAILAFQAETTDPWKSGANIEEAISYLSGIDKDTAHTDAGVAASVTTITNNGTPATKKVITLTTGVDTGSEFTGGSSADTFHANLDTNSSNTLNAFDALVGGGGQDTLYADIKTAVTPKTLTGIEVFNATFTGAVTLGLANATSATHVNNISSTENSTFTGLAATATTLKVENIASDTTNFTFLTTSGSSDSATVAVDNVTGGTDAEIEIDGVETLTFNSGVAVNSYEIAADAATTLNLGGSTDQTVVLDATTLSVSKFDASSATGSLTLTSINQTGVGAGIDQTVIGGSGNDTLTLTLSTSQDVSVSGGAGNDSIVHTTLSSADTVDGGDGTDSISMLNAAAIGLDASTRTTFTNVEELTITDHFDESGTGLSTQLIATSLNTVNLTLNDGDINDEAESIVGPAGSFTVNLGSKDGDANGTLGAALTIIDTGSATTDSLTIGNKQKLTSGANVDVFDSFNVTSTGYENVTINTGGGTGVADADILTLTITPDAITATPINLTLTGTNSIDITTSLTTTSTGLLTVDGSALTAQAGTVNTLKIDATSQGTDGTANITGSEGKDVITVGNFASTITGGAGNDSLTGGTASADSISGGAGNDTISGGGGNDTLLGGDGNDTMTVAGTDTKADAGAGDDTVNMNGTLTAGDTISGGAGNDTIFLESAATASSSEGVSGFEVYSADAELTQDMVQLTGNTGFTRLVSNVSGTVGFTNVYNTTTELRILDQSASDSTSFDRLLDNTSNTLTVGAHSNADTSIIALTVDDEETLTIDDGAITTSNEIVITTLNAEDLTTLNVTGKANLTIGTLAAQTTASLTTVNASSNTGTISISGTNATLALTMTGSATAANTLVGGSGADTITGGEGADSLTGGTGADSITGGDAADTLVGGTGQDTLVGGAGADSLNAGSGNDTITGGDGADTFSIRSSTGKDTVTDFDVSQVDLIGISLADIEAIAGISDLVELDGETSAVATSATSMTAVTLGGSSTDIASSDTSMQLIAFTDNWDSAAEAQVDIRAYLTVAGTFAATDAFIAMYDDGTDTTIAAVTLGAATVNVGAASAVVTEVATLTGVGDVTKITSAMILAFQA